MARRVTDKDREEWGPEILDVTERQTRDVVDEATWELRQQVARMQHERLREKTLARLRSTVADFDFKNSYQPFVDWLQEKDPYSARVRQDMLREAFENGDADRCKVFFDEFELLPPTADQIRQASGKPARKPQPGQRGYVAPDAPRQRQSSDRQTVAEVHPQRGETARIQSMPTDVNTFYKTKALHPDWYTEAEWAEGERRLFNAVTGKR